MAMAVAVGKHIFLKKIKRQRPSQPIPTLTPSPSRPTLTPSAASPLRRRHHGSAAPPHLRRPAAAPCSPPQCRRPAVSPPPRRGPALRRGSTGRRGPPPPRPTGEELGAPLPAELPPLSPPSSLSPLTQPATGRRGRTRRRKKKEEGTRRKRKRKKEKGGRRKKGGRKRRGGEKKGKRKKKKEKEGRKEGGRRRGGGGRRRKNLGPTTFRTVRPRRRPCASPTKKVKPQGYRPSCRCVVDGLHAGLWLCEPSCSKCGRRPSCRLFLAGFGNLPAQGRFYRNFVLIVLFFLFCRAGLVGGDPEHLGDPDHRPARYPPLRPHPRYKSPLLLAYVCA